MWSELRRAPRPVTAAVAWFVLVTLHRAWIAEDAFLTMRTLDNLVRRGEPTWNLSERVQAYAHPLWLAVLAPVYAVTREPYFGPLAMCLALSAAAVWILGARLASSPAMGAVAVGIASLSGAFVDYSTSGLENPLANVLLCLFYGAWFGGAPARRLFLLAALVTLTRFPLGLLCLPALCLRLARRREFGAAAQGLAPIAAWLVFAIVYYGFPLPSAAYAQLYSGITDHDLVRQGFAYLMHSLKWDLITVTAIAVGCLLACLRRTAEDLAAVAGIALALAFVLVTGGDHASGRLFTAPFLAAVALIARHDFAGLDRELALYGVLAAAGVGLSAPVATYSVDPPAVKLPGDDGRVVDARAVSFGHLGLVHCWRTGPRHPHREQGERLADGPGEAVVTGAPVLAYYAGPAVHVVDTLAWADPLLARLPMAYEFWMPGRWRRERLPVDAAVRERVELVTRGSLFSAARWRAIAELNRLPMLAPDYGLPGEIRDAAVLGAHAFKDGDPWREEHRTAGFQTRLPAPSFARAMDISVDNNDVYWVQLFRGPERVGGVETPALPFTDGKTGLRVHRLRLPDQARAKGYDRVAVFPLRGDGVYAVGHVLLLR